MSQQQQYLAHSVQGSALESAKRSADARRQTDLALDLIILEAGLRLKVLPLRDAAIRGRQLRFSEAERRARQRTLFDFGGSGPLRIIDVGLFADTVVRRRDAAQRVQISLRSNTQR